MKQTPIQYASTVLESLKCLPQRELIEFCPLVAGAGTNISTIDCDFALRGAGFDPEMTLSDVLMCSAKLVPLSHKHAALLVYIMFLVYSI